MADTPNDQFEQWLSQIQADLAIQGNNQQLTDAQINQLKQQWSTVPPAQQASVLKALQGNANLSSTQQIMAALPDAQKTAAAQTPNAPTAETENISPTGAVSSTAVGTGTPVEGSSQATALINQYMTSPLWQGDPNDPQGAANALGIDYTSADQQYQAYTGHYAQAQKRFSPGIVGGTYSPVPPMSETEFIQGLAQTQYGQWGPVIGMMAYAWQEQNGTPMPPDLAQQVIAGLKNIPANDASQLQTQMLNSIEQISNAAKQATAAGGQATDLNLNVEVSTFLSQLSTYAPSVYSGGGSSSGGAALADASPGSIVGQYNTAHPAAAGLIATQQGSEKAGAIDFLNNLSLIHI